LILLTALVLPGCTGPVGPYPSGELVLSPEALDFGDVVVGEEAQMVLLVSNVGEDESSVRGEFEEPTGVFELVSCIDFVTVDMGGDVECRVLAAPSDPGEHTDTLRLVSDAIEPELFVPLSVYGIEPDESPQ